MTQLASLTAVLKLDSWLMISSPAVQSRQVHSQLSSEDQTNSTDADPDPGAWRVYLVLMLQMLILARPFTAAASLECCLLFTKAALLPCRPWACCWP